MTITGLTFLTNGEVGSNIDIVWDGSNLLPRTSHTALWYVKYYQQTGYYAVAWSTSNDGSWYGSNYEFGTHPHPNDGTYYSGYGNEYDGQAAGIWEPDGTVHYFEIAGLGTFDYIQGPGDPTLLVPDGRWLLQARQCYVDGTDVHHRFYPDVVNYPGVYIDKVRTTSELAAATSAAVDPAFMIGCSPWSGYGSGQNDETPGGTIRGIRLFNDGTISIGDIALEGAAAISGDNIPATSAGTASVWYINDNPTPTDVTDKSSAGHDPYWLTSYRPTLYTELDPGTATYEELVPYYGCTNFWDQNGDQVDSIGSLTADGGTEPSYTTSIIPNSTQQCGDYNGSSSRATIPNSASINTATTYEKSILGWFIADTIDTTGNGRIIWGEGGSSNGLAIYTYDGSLYFNIYESTTMDYLSASISTGTLYFFVATMDCTAGEAYLYINGSVVDSKTGGLNISTSFSSHSSGIAIGSIDAASLKNHLNGALSGYFDGKLQGIAYKAEDTVLTSTQVGNLYDAGVNTGAWENINFVNLVSGDNIYAVISVLKDNISKINGVSV